MKASSLIIFASINLLGAALIVWFGLTVIRLANAEQRSYYEASDSFSFLTRAVPVVGVCLALDIFWAIKAAIGLVRQRDYRTSAVLGVVIIGWCVAFGALRVLA